MKRQACGGVKSRILLNSLCDIIGFRVGFILFFIMPHSYEISVTATIEAHEPSKQPKKNQFACELQSSATILQFLQELADTVKILTIPLDQVAVEVDDERISNSLRFEDILFGKKQIMLSIKHQSLSYPLNQNEKVQTGPKDSAIITLPPTKPSIFGNEPPIKRPSEEVKPLFPLVDSRPLPPQKLNVVIHLVDGNDKQTLNLECEDYQSYNDLQQAIFQKITQGKLLGNFNPQIEGFKVFCNGNLFSKKNKAFATLGIISKGKIQFTLQRQFPGGGRNI